MSRGSRQPPILRTKLFRPRLPADAVRRIAALELMASAAETPVTLVCAPAGYGKSLLVSQWLEEREQEGVWLSLEESESDLRHFLTYLLAGLDDLFPGAFDETWSLLEAPEPPSTEGLARAFSNDLGSLDSPAVLILDDYHRLETTSDVHDLLGQLIEHPPHPLRLIVVSRRDPPLPLVMLRASALLTEIRMRDLRFGADETEQLLATSAGLEVSPEAIARLQHQIEGWAVGLRLVLAVLRHTEDANEFLMGLRGDLQQIQSYLLQEVLSELPPGLRRLVVLSSIFERFCMVALDAVGLPDREGFGTSSDSARLLEALRHGELLAQAIDADGTWFRYHHHFRGLLQVELERQLSPTELQRLHRRASAWFESQGLIDEALTHALAAEEPHLAADVVMRHYREDCNRDLWHEIERWLNRLPAELLDGRPDLLVARVMVAQETGEMFAMAALAEKAAAALERAPEETELRAELDLRLGMIDVFLHCDGRSARRRLERARPHLPASTHLQANCAFYLASARAMLGEGEAAVAELAEQIRTLAPSQVDMLGRLLGSHAMLSLVLGDLVAVERSANRLLNVVRHSDLRRLLSWGHYFEAASRFHRHELDDAVAGFQWSGGRPNFLHRRIVLDALAGLAYCHQALGRDELAESALRSLEELTRSSEPHHVDVVDSCRARLQLRRGEGKAAAGWARSFDRDLHPSSIFCFLEVPVLTQARVWIATGSRSARDGALARLNEIHELSSGLHFNGQLIEIDALRAVALAGAGQKEEALDVVASLVDAALPQGWIRPLVEAGPTMAELLEDLGRDGRPELDRAELGRLVTEVAAGRTAAPHESRSASQEPPAAGAAADALTNRELDVLGLLAQRLQDKEIAAHLGISSHTVKTHLKRIYEKLGVGGRRQAVTRALSLGILEPET